MSVPVANVPHKQDRAPSATGGNAAERNEAIVDGSPTFGNMIRLADLELGAVLSDRYRLTDVAGTGGMAVVYKALDEASGEAVAIKVLRRDAEATGARTRADERFMREATIGARLRHPNCVGVIDSGQLGDGTLYLVMQFVEGLSLRDSLADRGRLPWREALAITAHLLRGLEHAHAHDVLHRDIKPENIVLSSHEGDVAFARLIDFGISKLLAGQSAEVGLTGTGIIIGTPRYLSPEQAVGGEVGPATDLYALSCVLFEMLTGQPPFGGDDLVQVVTAHAMKPAPNPCVVAPDAGIPDAVASLVLIGLRKRPEERPPTATSYLTRVESLLRNPEATEAFAKDVPDASHTANSPPLEQRGRGRLKMFGVVASMGAVLAIAFAAGRRGSLPAVTQLAAPPPPDAAPPAPDPELLLKASLHDLANGRSCADRLVAVEALRKLGDKRAVAPLLKARYRMRGGFLGFGEENANRCLRSAAEAAVRELDPEALRPSRRRR